MDTQIHSLEEVSLILKNLRQNPKTLHRFPKELWLAIIKLTESHSIEYICKQLQLKPRYLQSKISQYSSQKTLEFQEITLSTSSYDTVIIELHDHSGLSAKIQGPLSALHCLTSLFRR